MSSELVQNLTAAGIVALVGAVWRLGDRVARQNGTVAALVKELDEHKGDDKEAFARIFDRLDKPPPLVVPSSVDAK